MDSDDHLHYGISEYKTFLESTGWTENKQAFGLFEKTAKNSKGEDVLLRLSVYVDDSLMSSTCPKTADREMRAIVKFKGNPGGRFEGTVVESKD